MAAPRQDYQPAPGDAVGLLAGAGRLPLAIARSTAGQGLRVVAIGLKGEADPELAALVDEFHWSGVNQLGRWIRIFKQAGVAHAVMCGGITKANMYRHPTAFIPDLRAAKMWYSRMLRSRQDHTLLEGLVEEFAREGIQIESCTLYCPELLAPRGCLTRREPTGREWVDIRFAWPLVKQIAAMQIGQTIVVKDRAVVAVEGMDGTDATLRRAGQISRGKLVAVKVAKDGHDPRFDIPCVGPGTVDVLREAGVSVLALEADQTILLERDEILRKADASRVTIVALTGEDCRSL